MTEQLIKVNNNEETGLQTVDGRELHAFLEVETRFDTWFARMCECGFVEGTDFCSFLSESTGGRPSTGHILTIDMAKEVAMLQRTDKGKEVRQYFIALEKAWNTPEAIMDRVLKMANARLEALKSENQIQIAQNALLTQTIAEQETQIEEMTPKVNYYDTILQCIDPIAVTVITADYGKSAQWMNETLQMKRIQRKVNGVWILIGVYKDQGYVQSKTCTYTDNHGTEHSKIHMYWTQKGRKFIYEILKEDGILPLIEQEQDIEEAA